MRDFPVPSGSRLGAVAEKWSRGEMTAADTALAATVMLVRERGGGSSGSAPAGSTAPAGSRESADSAGSAQSAVEVFLMRRVASMAFAPSMLVFPGGRVDDRDARPDVSWAGRTPQEWAMVLGTEEADARLLVTAAIRELFEECGVLLAGPDAGSVVADVGSDVWHERRLALARHELSLAEVLAHEGLVLRTDLLGYRAHWVTPVFEPRRYDTRFFAATLPRGQVPDDRTSEADHADWADPAATLEALERGEVAMLPPTRVCLEDLASASSLDEVVSDVAGVVRVLPELTVLESGLVLRTPLPSTASGRRR